MIKRYNNTISDTRDIQYMLNKSQMNCAALCVMAYVL